MSEPDQPVFPLTVVYRDGTQETYATQVDVEGGLEYFDSEEAEEEVVAVFDHFGRPVRLRIYELRVICWSSKNRIEEAHRPLGDGFLGIVP